MHHHDGVISLIRGMTKPQKDYVNKAYAGLLAPMVVHLNMAEDAEKAENGELNPGTVTRPAARLLSTAPHATPHHPRTSLTRPAYPRTPRAQTTLVSNQVPPPLLHPSLSSTVPDLTTIQNYCRNNGAALRRRGFANTLEGYKVYAATNTMDTTKPRKAFCCGSDVQTINSDEENHFRFIYTTPFMLKQWEAAVVRCVDGRGLHSSTSQPNLSRFGQ